MQNFTSMHELRYTDKKTYYDLPFYLLIIFLLLDYGRPQSFFPVIGALYPGAIIQSLLFFCLLLKSKLFNFKNIQTKCFLGLIILMTIHVPIAVNNYWAYQNWKTVILYFIVYLSIISFIDSFSKIEKFLQVWIIINIIGAIVGLRHGGKIPNSSFMGDENDFALVMNMAIPFAYFMFLGADSLKKKIFYLAACGLFIAANVATLSRGGFIGLVPVVLYCWYKTPKKIMSTVIVALMVGVLFLSAKPTYWDEVRSIKEENIEKGTGEIRWYSWKLATRMFLDHPIIGVGQGNYNVLTEDYQTQEELLYRQSYRRNMWGRAAHSLYFTLLAELGLAGLILFFGMLISSFRDIRRLQKKEAVNREIETQHDLGVFAEGRVRAVSQKSEYMIWGIIGSLFSFLVSAFFLSVLDYPHFWILIGLLTAAINAKKS